MSSSVDVDFEDVAQQKLDEVEASFNEKVTVAIIGKVSAGKSTMITTFPSLLRHFTDKALH